MKIEEIPIDKITSNPMNPREKIDREKIDDLANSLKTIGIKVPIIVRPKGKMFELVSGERRWTAAKQAKLKTITAIVKELSDDELAIESLMANEFRENLDPWERAKYLKRLKNLTNAKNDADLGKILGMSKSAITNAWAYLDVDGEVEEKVHHGELEARSARAISRIENKDTQRKIAEISIKKDMSVKDTEVLVSAVKSAPKEISKAIIEEKIEIEDVKPLMEYGIPEDKVDATVEELTIRKKRKEDMKKIELETDYAVLDGDLEAKEILIDTSADEKRLRKFQEISDVTRFWTVTTVKMIVTESMRQDAIKCVREVEENCRVLLQQLEEIDVIDV